MRPIGGGLRLSAGKEPEVPDDDDWFAVVLGIFLPLDEDPLLLDNTLTD